jgi:ACS family tartrate transporter-like MFS transporter
VIALALTAAAALVAAAVAPSDYVVLAMLTIATAAIYATLSPFWVIPPSFLAGAGAAAGIALINATGNLGGYVGPMMIGALRERTGAFGPGLMALAASAVFAAAVIAIVARTVQPRHS